jgi:hypothetical protein
MPVTDVTMEMEGHHCARSFARGATFANVNVLPSPLFLIRRAGEPTSGLTPASRPAPRWAGAALRLLGPSSEMAS